jgi:hypothetical protein
MFSLTLDNPTVSFILDGLEGSVSDFPLEINEEGIEIVTMDDEKHMAIWVHLAADLMNFEFEGDDRERYVVSSTMLVKALKHTAYPIEMGSLMDGSLKINSANGRQTYKIKIVRDRNPESGDFYRNKFGTLMAGDDFKIIKVMKTDLRQAIKTVAVAGSNVKITLDNDALLFDTSTLDEIDGSAVAPLVEPAGEDWVWTHNFDIKLLKFLLDITKDNTEVSIYLFSGENDSILVEMGIGENSFARLYVAAAPDRRAEEEGESE